MLSFSLEVTSMENRARQRNSHKCQDLWMKKREVRLLNAPSNGALEMVPLQHDRL